LDEPPHPGLAEPGLPLQLHKPRPLELLAGFFIGFEPQAVSLDQQLDIMGANKAPRAMFEQVILRGLSKPPCVIGFSGGRDSSAVLAVAVHLARREGLPLPVAFTERYPAAPSTHEDEWQERVIAHLGVKDWDRVDFGSEFDAVGDLARRFIVRHGVTLGHLQKSEVIFGRAAGGSYMDGEGGDEVLGFRRATPVRRVLSKPTIMARPRAYRWLAFHLAPRAARVRNWERYHAERLEARRWLRPAPYGEVLKAVANEFAADPFDARQSQWLHLSQRRVAMFRQNRQRIAQHYYGATYVQPFLEPEFVAAWARRGGLLGMPDRTTCMRDLFSDVLPDAVLARTSKATFNTVFLGEETRAFAGSWDGTGLDGDLVDVDALRREWLSDWPSNLTSGLLQTAWLANHV